MNRRSFLATLAAGLTLDPERLLWRPGAKMISIPKRKIFSYSINGAPLGPTIEVVTPDGRRTKLIEGQTIQVNSGDRIVFTGSMTREAATRRDTELADYRCS